MKQCWLFLKKNMKYYIFHYRICSTPNFYQQIILISSSQKLKVLLSVIWTYLYLSEVRAKKVYLSWKEVIILSGQLSWCWHVEVVACPGKLSWVTTRCKPWRRGEIKFTWILCPTKSMQHQVGPPHGEISFIDTITSRLLSSSSPTRIP